MVGLITIITSSGKLLFWKSGRVGELDLILTLKLMGSVSDHVRVEVEIAHGA